MPDMLVKLYELPELMPRMEKLKKHNIEIRHPLPPEKHLVVEWVRENFSDAWASECECSFSKLPVSCYIAIKEQKIVGFACYEVTCKNYFGPTGVGEDVRGLGIGTALLIASMQSLAAQGYAYAVIGGAGPVEYYKKVLGAIEIEGSSPGIYKGMLYGNE